MPPPAEVLPVGVIEVRIAFCSTPDEASFCIFAAVPAVSADMPSFIAWPPAFAASAACEAASFILSMKPIELSFPPGLARAFVAAATLLRRLASAGLEDQPGDALRVVPGRGMAPPGHREVPRAGGHPGSTRAPN